MYILNTRGRFIHVTSKGISAGYCALQPKESLQWSAERVRNFVQDEDDHRIMLTTTGNRQLSDPRITRGYFPLRYVYLNPALTFKLYFHHLSQMSHSQCLSSLIFLTSLSKSDMVLEHIIFNGPCPTKVLTLTNKYWARKNN